MSSLSPSVWAPGVGTPGSLRELLSLLGSEVMKAIEDRDSGMAGQGQMRGVCVGGDLVTIECGR